MAPIRIGMIGLSTVSDATNWAAVAHLPYLQASDRFEIVALCNSSVERAKASIKHYELSDSTRAYGSSEDLANDPDVDLVVNVTGVGKHYELLMPAVQVGKNCFTELPLAVDIEKTRQLVATAKQSKIRTMMGMQGQANPVLNTIKRTIQDGGIGKVVSSTVHGYAVIFGGKPMPTAFKKMFDRRQGVNMVTVWFLHTFNNVQHVLGDFEYFSSMLGITHPEVGIFDLTATEKKISEKVTTTTPDQIFVQGKLASGALLTYHLEGGDPFPGEPGLRWHVVGDQGELMITNPIALVDMVHSGAKILLYEKGEPKLQHPMQHEKSVEPVEVKVQEDSLTNMKDPAQNVGRLYEAYADGKTDMYPDWNLGLKRHELIEEMFQRWDGDQPFGPEATYIKRA
ncbi:transcription regulator gal80 [Elasticomyces elasticus]|nr:transcription regulator gal80 [Elasticomyces elasticus]KAK5011715.1 hypothetical protein LTR28_007254 [Elasticomyces elasticus]